MKRFYGKSNITGFLEEEIRTQTIQRLRDDHVSTQQEGDRPQEKLTLLEA